MPVESRIEIIKATYSALDVPTTTSEPLRILIRDNTLRNAIKKTATAINPHEIYLLVIIINLNANKTAMSWKKIEMISTGITIFTKG